MRHWPTHGGGAGLLAQSWSFARIAFTLGLLEQEVQHRGRFRRARSSQRPTRLRGNVRIRQGPMSIEAEEATGNALQTENSRWTFERRSHADRRSRSEIEHGNRRICEGRTCRGAGDRFARTFRTAQRQPETSRCEVVPARSSTTSCKGIVKLTEDVWFSYGGNEFRGDVVVYNVRDERVAA